MNVRSEFRRHLALLSCSFPSHLVAEALNTPPLSYPPSRAPTLFLVQRRPQPGTFQLHVERFLNMEFYIHFLIRAGQLA